MPPPRRGRRPGAGSSRQAVLEAARLRFAQDGYAQTTIRIVASDAGVDASQVMQFFRTKDELFAAVLDIPAEALDQLASVFEGAHAQLGARVVRAFLQTWDGEPAVSESLLAMLRGAMVNASARNQLRDFIQSRLRQGTLQHDAPDTGLRAGLASAMLVGVVTGRQIVGVSQLTQADHETLVALLAPVIQLLLVPAGASAPRAQPLGGGVRPSQWLQGTDPS